MTDLSPLANCSAPNCTRIATLKGLCNTHYRQQLRHGKLFDPPEPSHGRPAYRAETFKGNCVACPKCRSTKGGVLDSRPLNGAIRRRRVCGKCGERFSTIEVLAGTNVTPDELSPIIKDLYLVVEKMRMLGIKLPSRESDD